MQRASAFTIIELVLALAIAAVVLASINSVFFGALHLRDATLQKTANLLPVNYAVDTLKQDLLGILPPSTNSGLVGVMGTDATMVGINQTLILELFTSDGKLTDDVPWGDVQKIDYWLQDPTNRQTAPAGKDLIRGITRNLLASTPESPEPHRLIGGVQALRFSYYDGTNWNDTWSTTLSNIPVAIKAFLTFVTPKGAQPVSPPIQFVVPIVNNGITNTEQ